MTLGVATTGSFTEALGLALLHSLWQGALIGLLAATVLPGLRSAAARYAIACVSMAACALALGVTLALLVWPFSLRPAALAPTAAELSSLVFLPRPSVTDGLTGAWPTIVAWGWIVGVACFGSRFVLQWVHTHRLATRHVSPPDDAWSRAFQALKREIGVGRAVRLVRSTVAEVPMVVGCVAPVVLVPVSAFTALTPDQLRSVLVHELAHIRRHDHWVNMAQVVIETVFFFHPAVWWLSARVRLEREHCCDDAVVNAIPHPHIFAEALAQLESLRHSHPRAALAANGGSLMHRIRRILGTDRAVPTRMPGWRLMTAIAAGAMVTVAGVAHSAARAGPDDDRVLEIIKQLADAGAPEDQVRNLYDLLVAPESETELKIRAEIAQVRADIRAAIESGRISEREAEKKLHAVEREFDDHRDMVFSVEVLGLTKGEAYLAVTRENLDELVTEGELSREEADRKLAELHQAINLREEYAAKVSAAAARVDEMVAAGEMTAAEGLAKMEAVKRSIEMRMRLMDAAAEMKAMVEAGKLTQEQADERLAAMKARIAGASKKSDVDWGAIKARVEGAVERGDMTREEADRVYAEIHARIAAGGDGKERGDDERPDAGAHIAGTITEVGRDSLTLRTERGEVRVLVTDRTRITLNDREVRLQDLERGDGARVHGKRSDRGFVATTINAGRRAGDDGGDQGTWIGGAISEIGRDHIVVRTEDGEVRVLVTDRTRITLNGRAAALGDLQVRDTARVQGERTDRGFVATRIMAHRK